MGRKPLSEYPPDVAAKMRADMSRIRRQAWVDRDQNGYGTRQNGAIREEVQEHIATVVKHRWTEGAYADRVNGMAGKTGAQHPNWTWGRPHYAAVLGQFEQAVCAECGATEEERPLNVHHIDEDHNNYLLSNLIWTCVPCHAWRYHYTDRTIGGRVTHVKQPFVTVTKKMSFEYAHVLPWHPGKCARLHGHSGHLEVSVRGRLDPFGIVVDFGDLKDVIKMAVIDPLDHTLLNEVLPNPTSEALLPWVWHRLELAGMKGLTEVKFSETDNSGASIGKEHMVDAYGWDRDEAGTWMFVNKVAVVSEGWTEPDAPKAVTIPTQAGTVTTP